jgi:uncharacterized protein YjiS (DUF1127 family)
MHHAISITNGEDDMERTLRLHATAGLSRLARKLWAAALVRRERDRLSRLDDHLLRDIGLDRDAARREASRPLWDAPERWTR